MFATIDKFQTTGVAQKHSCIIIDNRFEKSGTNVDRADVNLVIAIKKQYTANIIYIIINIFGKNPNIVHTTVAIKNKNIATNEFDNKDIIGIVSIGNTTFLPNNYML